MTHSVKLHNTGPSQPSPSPSFAIHTPPQTDIFASPTHGYHFSAPLAYVSLALPSFHSVDATITLPFIPPHAINPTLQFDQGGLLFVLLEKGHSLPSQAEPSGKEDHPRWIKAGVEFWEGVMRGSVVVRDEWSDWGLFDVHKTQGEEGYAIDILLEREGAALMVWVGMGKKGQRMLVRKVPWVFLGEIEEMEVVVGVYGARPDPYGEAKGRELMVGVQRWSVNGELVAH